MTATATTSSTSQILAFYRAPIGKKAVMAVTGAALFVFVIGHLLGNLQVYLGPEKLNAYGHLLQSNLVLLWAARLGLLACVTLHIIAAVQLQLQKNAARPISYKKSDAIASSYASRTMIWSGPILAAFIVYHLLHLTVGSAHPDFIRGDVYHNLVRGMQVPAVAIAYIVSMVFLGLHLVHGVWSMFQTMGIYHPRYNALLQRFATVSTALIVAGNISIPVSIVLGIIR